MKIEKIINYNKKLKEKLLEIVKKNCDKINELNIEKDNLEAKIEKLKDENYNIESTINRIKNYEEVINLGNKKNEK